MTEPLITEEQMMRDAVRIRLRHDLERVVTAVWWGVYTLEDALLELRGQAYLIAVRMKIAPEMIRDACVDWIDLEMARHEAEHAASREAMIEAALAVLRENGTRAAVRKAVSECARDRPLLPPTHIMNSAVEIAALEHRRAETWWKKREPVE